MADTRLTPQKVVKTGTTVTVNSGLAVLATTDYVIKNNGRVIINPIKTGAGACSMIIKTPAQMAGLDIAEVTVTVAATTGNMICGPFPPSIFNDANGDMRINFSEVTGLTVGVFEI